MGDKIPEVVFTQFLPVVLLGIKSDAGLLVIPLSIGFVLIVFTRVLKDQLPLHCLLMVVFDIILAIRELDGAFR